MQVRMEALDRATLRFWRTTNVVSWTALAVAVGVVIHQSWVRLVPRIAAGWFNGSLGFSLNSRGGFPAFGFGTFWFGLPRYFAKGIGEVLIGFAIGGIVGAKVWKKQRIVAAVAALAYALITTAVLEYTIRFLPTAQNSDLGVGGGIGIIQHGFGGAAWTNVAYDLVGVISIITAALWAGHIARRHA